VEFTLTGSTFNMVCGSTKVGFPVMDVNQFPTLPEIPSVSGTISAEKFDTAVHQVSVASLRDELEPIFASIQIETAGSEFSLLATDKYRMALVEINWNPSSKDSDTTVMVPTKTLLEVAKTFGNTGDIAVSIMNTEDRQMIAFQAQNKSVTAGLIKGGFPPIKTMFAAEVASYAVVSKQDLLEATRRAMLVVDRDHHMRFNFNSGSIGITTNPGELTQASEEVDAELVGDPRGMELKPQYVIDGLSGIHTEFAKIGLTNMHDNPAKASPLLIAPHSAKNESDSFRYLLQPRLLSN
jgi:DNA polymerase-3 subunit beta